jgi:hypothetical protein
MEIEITTMSEQHRNPIENRRYGSMIDTQRKCTRPPTLLVRHMLFYGTKSALPLKQRSYMCFQHVINTQDWDKYTLLSINQTTIEALTRWLYIFYTFICIRVHNIFSTVWMQRGDNSLSTQAIVDELCIVKPTDPPILTHQHTHTHTQSSRRRTWIQFSVSNIIRFKFVHQKS